MSEYAHTFHLVVASVGETRFDGAAISVNVPGAAGEMTLLPHHEPIVTTLKPGVVTVKDSLNEIRQFPIEGGVIECSGNKVVVLL